MRGLFTWEAIRNAGGEGGGGRRRDMYGIGKFYMGMDQEGGFMGRRGGEGGLRKGGGVGGGGRGWHRGIDRQQAHKLGKPE